MQDGFAKLCVYVSSTIVYHIGNFEVKFLTDNKDYLEADVITLLLDELSNYEGAPIAEVKRAMYRKFGIRVTITTNTFSLFRKGTCAKCGNTKIL